MSPPHEDDSDPSIPTSQSVSGAFPNTRWTLVTDARDGGENTRNSALTELYRIYWYPLYAFARRWGHSPEDAEDITQEFFKDLIEQGSIERAQQDRGRLRSFLLGALRKFMTDRWRKAQAAKRNGGKPLISIDAQEAETRYTNEPFTADTPELLFERRWALTLIDRVLARVRQDYSALGKTEVFDALKDVFGKSSDGVSYAKIGERLDMSESTARVTAFRLRAHMRVVLRDEIGRTLEASDDIADELRHIRLILSS